MRPDQATITKFKLDHPNGKGFRIGDDTVVLLRVPSRPQWRAFTAERYDASKRVPAIEALVRHATVFPPGPDLDTLLEAHPGFVDVILARVVTMAGSEEEAIEEKL